MRVFLAAAFILFSGACGGSVTPAAADLGGADLVVVTHDSGESENDASPAPDGFALVPCGAAACVVREGASYCCSTDYGKTGSCAPALGPSCGGGDTLGTACNETSDCGGPQVCCQREPGKSAFACVLHDQCPSDRDRLCSSIEDCNVDEGCCPYHLTGPSFRRCAKMSCATNGGADGGA